MNKLTVYLTHWCSDCRRARRFLLENNIPFEEINVDESPDAEELIMQANDGRRKVPTFELNGRFFSSSPFNSSQLAEDLAPLLRR